MLKIKSWLSYVLLALTSLGLFSFWQSPNSLLDPDSFYHSKLADLIKNQGIIYDFPWQQFTILKDCYIDHHFLFHLFLVPFTLFLEPFWAIKIAGIIFNTLFILLFFWLLKKYKIKFAFGYAFLLLFIFPFMLRLNLVKASAWSLIFLFLGIYFILRKKPLALGVLSFAYVWLYDGWPLLLLITLIYFLVDFKKYKTNLKLLISCLSGLMSGIIINPYFPTNLFFYRFHIINIGLINFKNQFQVGQEWYPYGFMELIMENNLAILVFFLGFCALIINYFKARKTLNKNIYYLFTLALIFLLLTLRSQRFIEYFIPCALLFSAFSITLWFKNFPNWPKTFLHYFQPRSAARKIIALYLILAILFTAGRNVYLMWHKMQGPQSFPETSYQGASDWLKQNTPSQSTVFNSDWDHWPMLFYHNTQNQYIVGLDPTFMYNYDEPLFNKYQDIITGQVKENIGQTIVQNFQANYVVVSHRDSRRLFLAYLQQDPQCQKVYSDSTADVFKINYENSLSSSNL